MRQGCGTCKFWQIETIEHGSCQHPTSVFMRHVVKHDMVPYAFKELIVTHTTRTGMICRTYEAKP